MNTDRIQKFLALTSDETSDFVKLAQWRKANKSWLKKSAAIAIKIHSAMIDQKINQKEFAKIVGVTPQYISKILRGSENLSLEIISKFETHLGIELIDVVGFSYQKNYEIPLSLPQVNILTWTVAKKIVQPVNCDIQYQPTNFEVPAA